MLSAIKFNSAKCETTCRLCLGRIKLLKNKKNQQLKASRRDVAELLRAGKQDYARIRVEAVIREELTLTAFEVLELFLELLAVRASLIASSKEIPRDMVEALSSVLYASGRLPELPELTSLHKMFSTKYGKEYVLEASSDATCARWCVNEGLVRCLTIEPPEPAVKLETLSEIAQEHGVEWDMDRARRELLPETAAPLTQPFAAATQPLTAHPLPAFGSGSVTHAPVPAAAAEPMAAPVTVVAPQPVLAAAAAPPGGYTDAAAAAAAAVAAAQQARTAAQAAAQLAAAGAAGRAAPPQGWLSRLGGAAPAVAAPAALPPPTPGTLLWMQPLPGSGGSGGSDGSGGSGSQGFRMPTDAELRRSYESAQGPPDKPGNACVEATHAPPPTVTSAAPDKDKDEDMGADAAAEICVTSGGHHAAPPSDVDGAALPGTAPPQDGSGEASEDSRQLSEYDELQRRFEALKRS